jgi:hypothetical protein
MKRRPGNQIPKQTQVQAPAYKPVQASSKNDVSPLFRSQRADILHPLQVALGLTLERQQKDGDGANGAPVQHSSVHVIDALQQGFKKLQRMRTEIKRDFEEAISEDLTHLKENLSNVADGVQKKVLKTIGLS